MIQYKNLVLATDFSDTARIAADHALALARAFDAKLHLLHVVEEFTYWESYNLEHFPPPDISKALSQNARLALRDLVSTEEQSEIDADTHVRHGKPFLEIIRGAREVAADVLVVGSHGQSGLAETLFGSTAEKVVRKAPCPVLVVRHPDHDFTMP